MAKTNDFSKVMQDMMGAFPVDTSAMQDAFKTQAAMGEKMSKVVLEAAEKSAEVSSKWTKDTLAKIGEVSTVKEEPADYAKAYTDFASASAEMAAEHMAAFADIAKRVQMDTVELCLAAGKDMSADATAAMQKATSDMTAAAKKASEDVTAAAKKASATAK
ncbi:phasin family protein [Rhodobacter sp. NTK016B]|uniref:phasin family protein n=1 Tax=Rhodobacter sp. NTK016B TaxID=2759676 RepID=UPI001A8C03D1|nr:phasin family protein [Rhodobacter sp. NTK016B]MBN8292382.1 phasin family protein [Rhodobacter sp. NTK016B]